jgi:hypothetical protein
VNEIKIVWMDGTVKTYRAVTTAKTVFGQLRLSFQERIDRSRQGSGRADDLRQRTVQIPLANVRWWGEPGTEVEW